MATIKITKIDDEQILFSDGSRITFDHEQDCCEYNYADFQQLDDLARSYKFQRPMPAACSMCPATPSRMATTPPTSTFTTLTSTRATSLC